jgi:DUF1009 family protein
MNANLLALKTAIEASSYRAFAWGIIGTLLTGDEQGMKYIIPQNITSVKLWAKTTSGTATIRIQKDTTDVKTTLDVTSTVGSVTAFDSAAVTAGQVLTLDIVAASGTDLFVTLESQPTVIV